MARPAKNPAIASFHLLLASDMDKTDAVAWGKDIGVKLVSK